MARLGDKMEYESKEPSFRSSTATSSKAYKANTPQPSTSYTTSPSKGDHEESIQEINILLLGETGVGKSTFINAFVNYLTYENLIDAEREDLTWLIATKFTITDENYENSYTIEIGNHENESQDVGASATRCCKSYVFPVDDIRVRLIDTPGIGDTRGIEQDNENFENILRYLAEYKELHAICILLKPNNARLTVIFQYCIKQLLSKLEKSASKNIIFLFTNSRNTFYRPGDTFPPLKKILNQVRVNPPHVEIPCNKNNIYCIDNEAFRFLAALKYNISFTGEEKKDFERSWLKSSQECWRMLKYVAGIEYNGLIPHRIQDTVSINEARKVIVRLSQPLAEVAQLIQNNLIILERHRNFIKENANNFEALKGKLYIPVINVRAKEVDQPRTVCSAKKCCEIYEVSDIKFNHYKTLCHNPCYLENVPKEIIGSPELIHCWAMNGTSNCRHCGCSYLTHMHIYYITEAYDDKIVDVNIETQMSSNKLEKDTIQNKILEIESRSKEFAQEEDTIIKAIAKFANFLQNNAIAPYNDTYSHYLKYLIDKENSHGVSANRDMIKYYEQMLQNYHKEKEILEKAFHMSQTNECERIWLVTGEEVLNSVQQLYSLKHTGAKIKELYDKQNTARTHEMRTQEEYVHPGRRSTRWLRLIFGKK